VFYRVTLLCIICCTFLRRISFVKRYAAFPNFPALSFRWLRPNKSSCGTILSVCVQIYSKIKTHVGRNTFHWSWSLFKAKSSKRWKVSGAFSVSSFFTGFQFVIYSKLSMDLRIIVSMTKIRIISCGDWKRAFVRANLTERLIDIKRILKKILSN